MISGRRLPGHDQAGTTRPENPGGGPRQIAVDGQEGARVRRIGDDAIDAAGLDVLEYIGGGGGEQPQAAVVRGHVRGRRLALFAAADGGGAAQGLVLARTDAVDEGILLFGRTIDDGGGVADRDQPLVDGVLEQGAPPVSYPAGILDGAFGDIHKIRRFSDASERQICPSEISWFRPTSPWRIFTSLAATMARWLSLRCRR